MQAKGGTAAVQARAAASYRGYRGGPRLQRRTAVRCGLQRGGRAGRAGRLNVRGRVRTCPDLSDGAMYL